MVRECRPPAREPARAWLARRSRMTTSTPANANSPANISPVGPAPTINTECSVTAERDPYDDNTGILRLPNPQAPGLGQRFYGTTGVLPQAPRCAIHS